MAVTGSIQIRSRTEQRKIFISPDLKVLQSHDRKTSFHGSIQWKAKFLTKGFAVTMKNEFFSN